MRPVHQRSDSDFVGPHERARALRKAQNNAEARLSTRLRAGRLDGFKFRRQFPIGNFVIDFCCKQTHLIVEVDGGQHVAQSHADSLREANLDARGSRVLRFWNNDVLSNIEGVIERIREHCASIESPLPYPLPGQGEGVRFDADRIARTSQRKAVPS